MQTFLPYKDFAESAKVLDRARLGKQRGETRQLLRVLTGASTAWANHPAVRMWSGHIVALGLYGLDVCDEWRRRGYVDHQREAIRALAAPYNYGDAYYPVWLGDEAFHASHRAVLLAKGWRDGIIHAIKRPMPVLMDDKKHGIWYWRVRQSPAAQIMHDDLLRCEELLARHGITPTNHYAQFGWAETMAIPDARGSYPYIWPESRPGGA